MTAFKPHLQKSLNPFSVWAIALGTILGFGAFVLPGFWLAEAGPMGTALGILLGGLMMLVIARSFGFMVRRFPVAGGEFVFAYRGFGRTHAFVCGWFLAVGYLSIVPLNATALPILGSFVAPHWLAQGYLYRVAGWEVYAGEAILSSLAIVLFGYLNLRGTKIVGQAQLAMVLLLVAAVGVMFAGTFLKPGVAFDNWRPLFAPGKTPLAAVLAILAIAPWAYVGFDTIPQAAEEFNFSAGKAFGLIALAIFFGAAAYITVTLATAVVFPWQELLAQRPVWATGIAIQAATGAAGVGVLVAGVTMAILTGINGFYLATSRLLFSMARVKVLPAWFARLHPVYNTPANAILFVGLLSLVAPWLGRGVILWVVDMSAVGVAIGYGYTALAAFRLSNGRPGERRWVHLLGAMFAASFLALLLIPGMPAFMAPPSWMAFAGWLALGAIFYAVQAGEYRSLPEARFEALIMGSAPAQSGD